MSLVILLFEFAVTSVFRNVSAYCENACQKLDLKFGAAGGCYLESQHSKASVKA